MRKLIIIAAAIFLSAGAQAQPWLRNYSNGPVNLQKITEEYKKAPTAYENDGDEEEEAAEKAAGVVAEKHDYHFDRWAWYMKQHTDDQGNIVSPLKTYQEWMAYKAAHGPTAAKGNGTTANWTFQGPSSSPGGYNGVGRIQAMAFHPTDSNTYWIGSGGGGAWKTTNNGVSWTCMTDMLPVLGISDIVINPLNPQVVYLCTGDRDAGDSYSTGVLKSTDGGATWNLTGLSWTTTQARYANSLIMNPLDTASLLLATSAGIYKSNDGGTSWLLTQAGSYKQILYRPQDSSVVFTVGTPVSGGSWSIFRSANAGVNWTSVLSVSGATRITLAVTPANREMVKAVVANNAYGLDGIYNSSDTGKTFANIYSGNICNNNILNGAVTLTGATCDGQGWYDLAITISPIDSNKVLVGGVNTYNSNNGGLTWQLANHWYYSSSTVKTVHADKHFLAFQPLRPTVLFEGCDGGVYRSTNPTSLFWVDITNGLGITQFYRNAVADQANFVLGGAQDNGSKRLNFTGGSLEQTGGDGMNCEIDYLNPSVYYTASQYGSINRTDDDGGAFHSISNNIPGQPQGDWITPYVISPFSNITLYAGYNRVYQSLNSGDNWAAISPVFNGNITRLATCAGDEATIYALVSNSIRPTYDGGVTWPLLSGFPSGTVSDIFVTPTDKKHIWITYSGFGTSKVDEYDTINHWKARNTGLPNVPVNCFVMDTSNGTKYVGTDVAVFKYNDTTEAWELYSNGLPAAEVRDLGINYTTGELWAATFGRGMWKSPKFDVPHIPTGISAIPLAMDVISVSPNPTDGHFAIRTGNAALKGRAADVRLIDAQGRVAWQSGLAFNTEGLMIVSAAGLARGAYTLQVTANNGMMAQARIIIL